MHTLIIANRDGSRTALNYDANRHLLGENGQLLPQYCKPECPEEYKRKKHGISLRIALGKECNFNCAYCHQLPSRESERKRGVSKAKKDKLDAFVRGLEKVCAQYGDIGHVQFWGGEPLVYFEEIKILQEGIAKLDPEINFGLCTNGSLVHGARFAWIRDQNIGLTLSYDGKGQHLRGTDVLRDPATAENLKQLFRERPETTSISAVVSKASGSPEDIIKYTSELLGVDKPNFGVTEHIMVVDEHSLALALSPQELQQYALSLHKTLIAGEVPQLQSCHGTAFRFIEAINKHTLIPDGHTRCFVSSNKTVTIDLDGNILPCQSFGAKDLIREGVTYGRGNIFADEEIRALDVTQLTERQKTRCSKCVMRQLCGGGCPYGPKEYEDYNCAANFAMSLPALGLAMHMLTGGILEEIREA